MSRSPRAVLARTMAVDVDPRLTAGSSARCDRIIPGPGVRDGDPMGVTTEPTLTAGSVVTG